LAAEATQWRLNAEDRTTERDAARSQRDEARAEVDSLTANVATLENQVTSLSERNEQLQEDLAAAREQLSWERLDEVPSGSEGQSYDWLTGTSPSETVEERAARLSQEPSIRPVDRLCYEHVPETYSINFCDSQALRFGGGTPEVLGI
jgi:chromosome segregation ATPase